MFKKGFFPGKYIQGAGAFDELPGLIKVFGSRGLILASPTAGGKVIPESGLDLQAHSLPVEQFGGACCEKEMSRGAAIVREKKVDVLIGMGGGKAIDTAKIVADHAKLFLEETV